MAGQQITSHFLISLCTHITYAASLPPCTGPLCTGVLSHKLTTSQPVVGGELQSIFRAVPAFPSKLELTLLDATLGTQGHTGSIGQIGLARGKGL